MGAFQEAFLEGANGAIYELKAERNTLGRVGGGAAIEVRDKSLSREHAEIVWEGGVWKLRDLNSKNKTFLNEVAIEGADLKNLGDGDQIHLGACPLKFRTGTPKAADIDATVAVDVAQLPFNKMFDQAGSPATPPRAASPSAATVPDGGSSRKAAVESAAAATAFGYLELRSVTNPVKYYLTKKTVRIGSDAAQGCDILLTDNSIQGAHVEIVFGGGKNVKLRNMAKTGTLLNGKRAGTAPIKDGDQIDLGDSSFTFRVLRLPEAEKKGGGLMMAVAVMLVLVLLGGGGAAVYFYKLRYIDTQPGAGGSTTTAGGTSTNPSTGGGTSTKSSTSSVTILRAIDEIKRLDYNTAAQTAARVVDESDDPETKARAQRLAAGLDLLRKAQVEIDNRLFLDARATVRSIPDGELKSLAADEIRRVELQTKAFVENTVAQIRDAENREEWKTALSHLESLRGNAEDLPIDPAKVRMRIDLKSKASDEIRLVSRNPLADAYNITGPRVQKLIADIEAKTAGDNEMTSQLATYLRTLKDIAAHADMIGLLYAYKGGSIAPIQNAAASISPNYPNIRDVQRVVEEAGNIQRLTAENERLIAAMGAEQDERKRLHLSEQLIKNREDTLALLNDSTKYELVAQSRNDLHKLRDFRKTLIVSTWAQAPDRGSPRDKEELLATEVAIRRHSFEVLNLFEEQVRRKIQNPSDINLVIADTELQNVYSAAWDAYNNSFTRATSVLHESQVDQQASFQRIRDDFQKLTDMLRDATLPEDENSRRRLDTLRERQLRGPAR